VASGEKDVLEGTHTQPFYGSPGQKGRRDRKEEKYREGREEEHTTVYFQ